MHLNLFHEYSLKSKEFSVENNYPFDKVPDYFSAMYKWPPDTFGLDIILDYAAVSLNDINLRVYI